MWLVVGSRIRNLVVLFTAVVLVTMHPSFNHSASGAEDWLQFQFDARHSGNAPDRRVETPLGLVKAVATTDAIFTAPVIADSRVFVLDGSGVVFCLDATTLDVLWKFSSRGGPANCNNVSSPAVVGGYLHFGTTAGSYYVLDCRSGSLVREIRAGGPIFGTPVVTESRAYFATVGARVYAVEANGLLCWTWDFVAEVMDFHGDRFHGEDWLAHNGGRTTWRDHFCCSRNLAVFTGRAADSFSVSPSETEGRGEARPGIPSSHLSPDTKNTVVIPAGGRTLFLEDLGDRPRLRATGLIPANAGSEYAAAFGQSIGEDGEVYVQWHRRDNAGRVEILQIDYDDPQADGTVHADFVPGTQTAINLPGLLSFSPVSVRGKDVYRCRPEQPFGFCKHSPDQEEPEPLCAHPSITPPVLLEKHGVYGGLDGRLHVVPLDGKNPAWSFDTAWGKPISAPAAVCDGRIYFGCEDGYLYVLGPDGKADLPSRDLKLDTVRSPLSGKFADPQFDWYTNYGDQQNTNANDQGIEPPLRIKWMRRYQGTFKHLPVCGGGRMYTHTAEGQVFAVEQETGRLLWRQYQPGVHLSFTSPIYYKRHGKERLLVPQAGIRGSRMRCLDAASGEVLWEAPFTGSPSWSRQAPPIVSGGLAIYASGSGRYQPQGTETAFVQKGDPQMSQQGEEIMSWVYTHNNPFYPKDNRPRLWAWDLDTGELVWQKDFSQFGRGGNDCGLCLMDGKLYYSTFFGYSAAQRRQRGLPSGPNGLTACLRPTDGEVLWLSTEYHVTAGCTISADDGRLYLGGYNQADQTTEDRHVFCLDAADGSLIWQSEPVRSSVNVVSLGSDYIFSNASGHDGHVFDRASGRIVSRFNFKYACTRFTCSGPFVLGANMDMIDLSDGNRLVSTGPCIDSRECVGSTVSNGRLFYTSQASGLQVSLTAGDEARRTTAPWEIVIPK